MTAGKLQTVVAAQSLRCSAAGWSTPGLVLRVRIRVPAILVRYRVPFIAFDLGAGKSHPLICPALFSFGVMTVLVQELLRRTDRTAT